MYMVTTSHWCQPLNGSDLFENPDGDGYDVNKDGVLTQNEMFVNYLISHSSGLFLDNQSLDGMELPNGFTTDLFDNVSDFGLPEADFASRASGAILAGQIRLKRARRIHSADSEMMECRMVGKFGLHDGTLLMMNGH